MVGNELYISRDDTLLSMIKLKANRSIKGEFDASVPESLRVPVQDDMPQCRAFKRPPVIARQDETEILRLTPSL